MRQTPPDCDRLPELAPAPSLLDAVPVPLLGIDGSGARIRLVNRAAADLLGTTAAALLGRDVSSLIPEWAAVAGAVPAVDSEHGPALSGHSVRVLQPNGQAVPVLLSVERTEDAGAPFLLTLLPDGPAAGVTVDHASRSFTPTAPVPDRFFELSGDLFCVADFQGYFRRVNPAWEQLLGCTREELCSVPFLSFVHPDDEERTQSELRSLVAGGQVFGFENRYRSGDGSYRWLSWRSISSPEEGLIYAVARDVTPRRQAEEALRRSEARYRRIVETTNEGICVSDPRGIITFVNPRMAQMLGQTPEEMVGRSVLDFIAAELQGEVGMHLEQRRRGVESQYDSRAVHRDGRVFPIFISAAPLISEQGVFEGTLAMVRDITERHQARRALEESEARYREIVDLAHEGIWMTDAGDRVTFANRQLAEMLGYSLQELLGRPVGDFLVPPAGIASGHGQAGLPERFEARAQRKDGAWIWLQVSAAPRLDEEGRFLGLVALCHDVTGRKRAEDTLREQARLATLREEIGLALSMEVDLPAALQAALSALVRHLPVAFARVWTLDPGRQELQMRASAGLYPEIGGPRLRVAVGETEIGRMVQTGEPLLNNDIRNDPVHGEWARSVGMIAQAGYPLRADGEPVGALVLFSRQPLSDAVMDTLAVVADRLAQFLERKQTQEALREAQARFTAFMDNTPAVALIRDEEGRYLWVNRCFETTFQWERDQVLGRTLFDLYSPELAEELRRNDEVVLAQGVAREFTERVPLKDGSTHEFLAYKFPMVDGRGRRLLGSISLDVTERRFLEEQLRQAQKMEAIGRLAGGVAHDFNNMLAVINGYSDLLLASADSEPGVAGLRSQLLEIREAGERAANLTRQLLQFGRKELVTLTEVDLGEVLRDMERMLSRLIGEDVELHVAPTRGTFPVRADRSQLEQVLLNLSVNARDAMPLGGQLRVSLDVVELEARELQAHQGVPPGRFIRLRVRDTGGGIEPDVLPHIWEPFFTTKEQGRGTGLGLATVYGIVEQAGGFVEVESVLDQGTTIDVFLPAAAVRETPDVGSGRAVASQSLPATLLLVEDEAQLRRLLEGVLRKKGYRVLVAGSGEEALALLHNGDPHVDLLITDVVMPRMGGRELAERLLAQRPALKVLYMSGYTDDAIVHHGVLKEGIPFLSKPFGPQALLDKVQELLEGGH